MMSEEGSPNLQKLRGFRYQRRPQITDSADSGENSLQADNLSSQQVIRKRIILPSDSDSEMEPSEKQGSQESTEKQSSQESTEKQGLQESTEKQGSQESTEKQGSQESTEKQGLQESTEKQGSQESRVTVANNSTFVSRYNGYNYTRTKNPSILEKEKQMKYLLELFPNQEAMKIHDCLSKHSFNTDAAAAELSREYNKTINLEGSSYNKWKEDYEKKQAEKLHRRNTMFEQFHTIKRSASDEPETSKKKVKRRRESFDSDESDKSDSYKHKRVFDSDEDSDVEISDELTGDKKRVLEFLQNATIHELQLMNTCSKKKAECVLELRPFTGWVDLVQKLESTKHLSTDLLNAAQQVLATRNNIKHLMKKCTSLAQQLERAVAAGAGVKEQPSSLSPSLQLTSYQMVGLNWLVVLFSQGVNGILADEMGLGKTVQIIAFLAHLKAIGAATSTHLVIVPSSTLDNWRNEFARWCPELRVFMYYGSTEERRQFRFDLAKGMWNDFDVILTTYTIVGNTSEERKMFRVTRMHYVIFDEAHMLKNMNTQRYENLIRINAKRRLLLTGTPLQNNLLELMSLLIFVMPKIFAEKTDDIRNLFQKTSKKEQDKDTMPEFEREQIEKAKRIMKPFVLRRLKCDVLQDLPKKTDHIINVPMDPTQKVHYEQLVASYKNINEDGETTYSGMSIMSDLRKLSNHPLLLRYHFSIDKLQEIAKLLARDPSYKDTVEQYIVDDLTWMSDFEIHTLSKGFRCLEKFILPDSLMLLSGKFMQLDKMLPELKQYGHRVLIFSQYVIMLNIVEEYLRIKSYKYLRLDGSTPVNIRQSLINEFTEDSSYFIFLLSTRAGGLGINLTAADTVIIHDIDFNPYNDKQAEDRCHRMGQLRPVTVYRFISQGTIEEGMLEMNKEKLKLEREITTDETDNPDVKSVVRLLSSALGIEASKVESIVVPKKTN